MRIELNRTFSTSANEDSDSENWAQYLRKGRGNYDWEDLLKNRLVMVLGEAGIGKTVEFQQEVARLLRQGKAAFFIPLNQIKDGGALRLVAKSPNSADLTGWSKSQAPGYFFLDAVDEARLTSHADFERALMLTTDGLRGNLHRVTYIVSSRITDWSVERVREAVQIYLARSLETRVQYSDEPDVRAGNLSEPSVERKSQSIDPFVVSLDPLSRSEAERLSVAFEVSNADGFWSAVNDGEYEFLGTRPLDLEWMVRLWNDKQSLGNYLEIVDAGVGNRLVEMNPSYQQAGAILSADKLREGAEQLAATCELSGRYFISTTAAQDTVMVVGTAALPTWKSDHILRLLGSALFDEASYGRVKFHHRATREYLAASWLARRLQQGLPLHHAIALFCRVLYGIPVLIPSRRPMLCWLAALNVQIREWVTREFPEMLVYEGDPEAWDSVTAARAFDGYINRVKDGLRTDWWSDGSEARRVARSLPSSKLVQLIKSHIADEGILGRLLPYAKHGRVVECADVVFDLYKRNATSPRLQHLALIVLQNIAKDEHRVHVGDELLSGKVRENRVIAAALLVAGWKEFSEAEFAKVFSFAGPEGSGGVGPMATALKDEILPNANAKVAESLLTAVLKTLPPLQRGQRFKRYGELEPPKENWLLDVLPDCTIQLLRSLSPEAQSFPDCCFDACEYIEALRYSGFVDDDEFQRLNTEISARPSFRWKLALEIARSEKIEHAFSRLLWVGSSLVGIAQQDVAHLIGLANSEDSSVEDRDHWFKVTTELAFRSLKDPLRNATLRRLAKGADRDSRSAYIASLRKQWRGTRKQHRLYAARGEKDKRQRNETRRRNIRNLLRKIESIRNGIDIGALQWLIGLSHNTAGQGNLTHPSTEAIGREMGMKIAEAFASGVVRAWKRIEPPSPSDHLDGSVPWNAITGLAGINVLFESGYEASLMASHEVHRAVKFAVWELDSPPSWFERLVAQDQNAVVEALSPWIASELAVEAKHRHMRGALGLTLNLHGAIRARLLAPVVQQVINGKVADRDLEHSLVVAIREEELADKERLRRFFRKRLAGLRAPDGLVPEIKLLGAWLNDDLASAWAWARYFIEQYTGDKLSQVRAVAGLIHGRDWVKTPPQESEIATLLEIYEVLSGYEHAPVGPVTGGIEASMFEPVAQLRGAIPRIFAQIQGPHGNRALTKLMKSGSLGTSGDWVRSLVLEHAARDAQATALLAPDDIHLVGSAYLKQPSSERELFEQVLDRLEGIRKGIEEGPYSDHMLFSPGIPEKRLQIWLAARLFDTPNRRFSVHREEEVHDENQPDIQVACPKGRVSIEVKPLDRKRGYSALSLVETLKTQLVGKYLKGLNSAHGVLVLFRLDNKMWEIPGVSGAVGFPQLISYLRIQADAIRQDSVNVHALEVVGVNCVPNR